MNEGTPSGSEHNKPWAVVLKGPNAELYLDLFIGVPLTEWAYRDSRNIVTENVNCIGRTD
jgi:hypothetical protein